jgi:hypothetical protein
MNNAIATYKQNLKDFTTCNAVETTLKRMLLAAVDPKFVESLQHPLYGFSQVTTRQILEHLQNTYGDLDQDALEANKKTLDEPWEPSETMEPLWKRVTDAQQVAQAGNDPITDASAMRAIRAVLIATGLFDLDIREWDKKPANDKTWANFRTFFTDANKDRVKKTTVGSAFTARAITRLENTAARMSPLTIGSAGSDASGSFSYCWTHGLTNNAEHTSKTCSNKAKGHQEAATLDNMMGGNNTIRRKRGEKNKFRELNPDRAGGNQRRDRTQGANNPVPRGAANGARGTRDGDDDTVVTSNSSMTNNNNSFQDDESP